MRRSSRTTHVRKRVWNIGRLLVLTAALLVTFGVFFLTAMRITTRAREVEVPDLRGKSIADARLILEQQGLSLRLEEPRRADKTVPADHVLTQDPAPGEVIRRQRFVRLRLSDGQRAPALPSVADLAERTAEATLAGDQIAVGYRAEVRSATYRPGVVIAQDPAPKERAATVNLLVNRAEGGATFVVPDLIGSLGIRAADILRSIGFRVAINSEVQFPGLPPGVVVRQSPQSGFRISAGDTITLEVSR
jgi:beta-lactam-binding protein with PASTA domain